MTRWRRRWRRRKSSASQPRLTAGPGTLIIARWCTRTSPPSTPCRKAHKGQPVCLVVGGEVTCPVTGPGMGGRNQAFALYAAERIAGQHRVVLSAGTDGRDGNSPTSGAVADGQTVSRALGRGLDPDAYLLGSDAYSFFRTLGDTLDTGFTDNNVCDVRIWLDFGA